jgi:hypothetical protein
LGNVIQNEVRAPAVTMNQSVNNTAVQLRVRERAKRPTRPVIRPTNGRSAPRLVLASMGLCSGDVLRLSQPPGQVSAQGVIERVLASRALEAHSEEFPRWTAFAELEESPLGAEVLSFEQLQGSVRDVLVNDADRPCQLDRRAEVDDTTVVRQPKDCATSSVPASRRSSQTVRPRCPRSSSYTEISSPRTARSPFGKLNRTPPASAAAVTGPADAQPLRTAVIARRARIQAVGISHYPAAASLFHWTDCPAIEPATAGGPDAPAAPPPGDSQTFRPVRPPLAP